MVFPECIVMNNCRLCHSKPGEYEINTDKKLIKEIYDCIKIRVNDKAMLVLPRYICEDCRKTIRNFFLYKQHIREVDQSLRKLMVKSNSECDSKQNVFESNIFKCSQCLATFTTQNNFEIHTARKCNNCDEYYSEKNCIESKESVDILNITELHSPQTDQNVLSTSTSDSQVFSAHNDSTVITQNIENSEGPIKCENCEKKCGTTKELKIHQKEHKTKQAKYICNWKNCKKILNSAYTLKTHELKHAGKRSFLCVTCGKGFITKNSLTCHEKIHLDVKGYICKLCNIGFSVRSNLRAHEKKHHEGIRFYCSQCTKVFVSKCSLERHERIHAGIKEFQCESCPSAFYTNKELVKHQRYHQGLRLHKCNECFKTFFERHHLVIHLRSHTGERPYVCKIPNCGKSFMESQKLKRHHKAKHAQM